LDSTNSNTWVAASRACQKMKQTTLAEQCLQHALTIDPSADNDDIYNQLGILYYHNSSTDKSLEAIAKAIKINPGNAVYCDNYAYISLQNKDIGTAEIYYRKAIKADPKYHSSYYGLSKILAAQSKNKEALKMLELAIKYGDYKRGDIEQEREFSSMKQTKEFREVISKTKE
jgi:tetratricopeptide (TPR) repeat protein